MSRITIHLKVIATMYLLYEQLTKEVTTWQKHSTMKCC